MQTIIYKLIAMANDFHFSFKADDIQMLIKKGATTIVASSKLVKASSRTKETQAIAPQQEAIRSNNDVLIIITAEGYDANNKLVATAAGCPCPPCNPRIADQY